MIDVEGLHCVTCGEACSNPQEHLAREDNATSHLNLDDPCALYEETNKWGMRWRLIIARHESQVRSYVDFMGMEDMFLVGGITIPSVADDHPSDWNTVGECLELAKYTHGENQQGYTRKLIPAPTGKEWAEELVQMAEQNDRRKLHIGTFGSHIKVMR